MAPRARDASSYSLGTALRAVSDTEMMEGRIITASTMMAASRSTAGRTTAATLGGATFAKNTAVIKPMGTPMRMAPAVP